MQKLAEVLWNNSYKIFLDSTWLAWFAGGMRIEGPATGVLLRDESNTLDHIKIEQKWQWFGGAGRKNTVKAVAGAFKVGCQRGLLLCHSRVLCQAENLSSPCKELLIYSRDDRKNPLSSDWLLSPLAQVSKDGDDAQKTKSDYLNQCNLLLPARGKTLLCNLSVHVQWMKL